MISRLLPASVRPFEFLLLLGLAFVLPLYEAPKNLFWLAYVVTWAWNRLRDKSPGSRWDGWDSLILAWIASGFIVAAFAGTRHSEWSGAVDVLRYGLVFWCVRKGGYSPRELASLMMVLLASCAAALIWGFWDYLTGRDHFIELNSVGHVNHSAPYIAICAGLAISWIFARWQFLGYRRRTLMVSLAVFLLAGLIVGASRAAIGAMFVALFVCSLVWWRRSRKLVLILAAVIATSMIGAILGNVGVVLKQRAGMEANDPLSHRGTIWRRALIGWEAYPWFGVGINNFNQISDDLVRARVEAKGQVYRTEDYIGANHAHNLYLNTLAERGLFGFGVFISVLLSIGASMWRHRPKPLSGDLEWTLWGAGMSAWIVLAFAGLLNTTLHHEIALLAMMIFGAWQSLVLVHRPGS